MTEPTRKAPHRRRARAAQRLPSTITATRCAARSASAHQAAGERGRDLSLAYSPGVAYACLAIEEAGARHEYTSRGNLVGVVTNGWRCSGSATSGRWQGKPVMEGRGA